MSGMHIDSEMNCEYALRDEFRNGSYVTKCDCPGGCPYKKETTKTGRGIVGECTKIFNHDDKKLSPWES